MRVKTRFVPSAHAMRGPLHLLGFAITACRGCAACGMPSMHRSACTLREKKHLCAHSQGFDVDGSLVGHTKLGSGSFTRRKL